MAAQRTEEKSTDPLVRHVEAWAVAVSPVIQETPVMLKAGLLTASTIVPACERQAIDQRQVNAWLTQPQATKGQTAIPPKFAIPTIASGRTVKSSSSSKRAMACTARALPFSVTVEQESFSLSRRLVQLHLQADHRQCHVKSESTKEFSDAKKNRPRYAT